MKDLRGDWSYGHEKRAEKVKELAIELGYPKVSILVDEYFEGLNEHGDPDGRFFRCDFKKEGGYENIKTFLDDPEKKTVTKEFLALLREYCNNPEYALPNEVVI